MLSYRRVAAISKKKENILKKEKKILNNKHS